VSQFFQISILTSDQLFSACRVSRDKLEIVRYIPVYEMTLESNILTIRIFGFHVCDSFLVIRISVNSEILLRDVLDNLLGIILQHPEICPWSVVSTHETKIAFSNTSKGDDKYKTEAEIAKILLLLPFKNIDEDPRVRIEIFPLPVLNPAPLEGNYEFFAYNKNCKQTYSLFSSILRHSELTRKSIGQIAMIPAFQFELNFLTCYEYRKSLSFSVYLEPFYWTVWPFILLTLVASVFIFVTFHQSIGNALFMTLSIIFEQGISLELKLSIFRFTFALMLLTWLILVNSFKGVVTTDLTLPVNPFRLETIREAIHEGFHILAMNSEPFMDSILRMEPANFERGFILKNGTWHIERMLDPSSDYIKTIGKMGYGAPSGFLKSKKSSIHWEIQRKLLSPKRINRRYNGDVDSMFNDCEKRILVGHNRNLVKYYDELKIKNPQKAKVTYQGRDDSFPGSTYLIFGPLDLDRSNKVRKRLNGVYESFLFGLGFFGGKSDRVEDEQESGPTPLSLQSKIVSMFAIYGICIGICFIQFYAEMWRGKRQIQEYPCCGKTQKN